MCIVKAAGEEESLYQKLSAYGESDYYPCHMPGHKRNPESGEMADFYRIDITEIDGFDNLHHAGGILKEAQERAGRLYGAEETHYLVNGSTCGVLASMMAVTERGDEILIARNCHRSVYHGAILQGLKPRYCYPGIIEEYGIYDGISPGQIGELLDKYPACRAVVVTSPTYEGIISDIEAVARTVHRRGKILIVDEAHGAHLGLSDNVPQGAVAGGADLVIHSLHKTLPSMTQTALLHVNGDRVDRERLRAYLTMLQSSSPSYVLMAGMDACVRFLEKNGEERFSFYLEQYGKFCEKTARCRHIGVAKMTDMSQKGYAFKDYDIGKLMIYSKDAGINGRQLYDMFREEYHLQLEMAAETFALAMMTVMDTEEGWQRLADAVCGIDDRIENGVWKNAGVEAGAVRTEKRVRKDTQAAPLSAVMTPSQAFHSAREEVLLQDSAGRISAGFINLYPPGIPLAVPGEALNEAVVGQIRDSLEMGLEVQGVSPEGKLMALREPGRFYNG